MIMYVYNIISIFHDIYTYVCIPFLQKIKIQVPKNKNL